MTLWINKYEPKTLDNIISHTEIISTIKNMINQDCFPHILLHGISGIGKTIIGRCLATYLYGKNTSLFSLFINISDNRGIEIIRDKVIIFAETFSFFENKFKLVVLDEADAMTKDAQIALAKIIEMYSDNIRFCIICNNIGKLNNQLISRCATFRLSSVLNDELTSYLTKIAIAEKINITQDVISTISKLSFGDVRQGINLFQTINYYITATHTQLTTDNVMRFCRQPSSTEIAEIIIHCQNNSSLISYLYIMNYMKENGISLRHLTSGIHKYIFDNVIVPQKRDLFIKLAQLDFRLKSDITIEIQVVYLISILKELKMTV